MSKDNGSNGTRRTAFEFKLELDLHLFFTPLMQSWGDGITMTRTIQLPFPPDDNTTIGGRSIEGDCKPPLGYRLNDTIWDVDRERFIATTTADHGGGPLAYITDDLDTYLNEGWTIGSWQTHYDKSWRTTSAARPGIPERIAGCFTNVGFVCRPTSSSPTRLMLPLNSVAPSSCSYDQTAR